MVCPKPEVTPDTVLPRPEVVFWAAEPMGPPSWVFEKRRGLVSEGGREGGSGVDCSNEKKRKEHHRLGEEEREGGIMPLMGAGR